MESKVKDVTASEALRKAKQQHPFQAARAERSLAKSLCSSGGSSIRTVLDHAKYIVNSPPYYFYPFSNSIYFWHRLLANIVTK